MTREDKPKHTDKPTRLADVVVPSNKRPTNLKKKAGRKNNEWLHWTYRENVSEEQALMPGVIHR
jgi:hypothetical protein